MDKYATINEFHNNKLMRNRITGMRSARYRYE